YKDGQENISIDLFEMFGQEKEIRDANKVNEIEPVAEFTMILKNAVPKGTTIEITMTLNNSGLISIHAIEKSTGSELDATYEVKGGMSDEEMDKAKARALVAVVQ
nr:Hsp70 family protein [Lachnospiraceae bacterium]